MTSLGGAGAFRASPSMARLLKDIGPAGGTRLDAGLQRYTAQGLELRAGGELVSIAASIGAHADRGQFCDITALEAFVNKVHLDDWLSDEWTGSVGDLLTQAIALAAEVGARAQAVQANIEVAISCEPEKKDVVFRFYGLRHSEQPWLDDPSTLQEAVLLLRYL